ncbi:MAG TPA: phosphate signaling complex protein PhoU [Anaerolineales bacterium]|nr:phosphate signaling complex protein PhoU [Anaerolineales bacterium]
MERATLDHEIGQLKDEMLILGALVEEAILGAATALKDHNEENALLIARRDALINSKRFETEGATIVVIATQQPVAHDLRVLTSILDLCTELERMGDYAKGIAVIQLRSGGLGLPKLLADLQYMAEKAVDMLHRALRAFQAEDMESAQSIAREDDLIDALYKNVYDEAINNVIHDATRMERINYLVWAAHNLERAADRVTNICERTVFVVTGEQVELSHP